MKRLKSHIWWRHKIRSYPANQPSLRSKSHSKRLQCLTNWTFWRTVICRSSMLSWWPFDKNKVDGLTWFYLRFERILKNLLWFEKFLTFRLYSLQREITVNVTLRIGLHAGWQRFISSRTKLERNRKICSKIDSNSNQSWPLPPSYLAR